MEILSKDNICKYICLSPFLYAKCTKKINPQPLQYVFSNYKQLLLKTSTEPLTCRRESLFLGE